MKNTLIVDLSHHQSSKQIDWQKAAEELALLIIRVQYGASVVDREYKQHVEHCTAYNIPFGHYAYGHFTSLKDAEDEANTFLKRADARAKFLVLDTEKDTIDAIGTAQVAEASQWFIDTLKSSGAKTGFYVSHELYKQYSLDQVNADFLWLPRYGRDDGTPSKKPDYPCDLWQFTQKGRTSFYNNELDLSQLNSDKDLAWFTS